jgi:glutamate decarboxylase
MAKELDAFEERTGISVPIHVDAASGGFVTPFGEDLRGLVLQSLPIAYPDFVWDFKIPRVHSINASGHKYGNAAVGCGWIVWRSRECLPKHLIFELHYLGAVSCRLLPPRLTTRPTNPSASTSPDLSTRFSVRCSTVRCGC